VVLDVGCNTGYGSRILAERAKKVIGIDVSKAAVEFANQKHSARNLVFQYADGAQIEFPDNTFDVVTSFQVIEHVQETDRYLSEIVRVLKPKGYAIFTTPNAILRLEPGAKPWNIFHVREYTPTQLLNILAPYFQRVEIRGLFAEKSLLESHLARIERARKVSRSKTLYAIKTFLQTRTNASLQKAAERFARDLIPAKGCGSPISFAEAQKKWSLESLEYRTDNVDAALDLMAICSN